MSRSVSLATNRLGQHAVRRLLTTNSHGIDEINKRKKIVALNRKISSLKTEKSFSGLAQAFGWGLNSWGTFDLLMIPIAISEHAPDLPGICFGAALEGSLMLGTGTYVTYTAQMKRKEMNEHIDALQKEVDSLENDHGHL